MVGSTTRGTSQRGRTDRARSCTRGGSMHRRGLHRGRHHGGHRSHPARRALRCRTPPTGRSSTRARRAPASRPACAPAGPPLSTAWTAHLDGAVYGQPLVVGGDVIAATENDSIYALSAATGKVIWRKHVGTPVPQSALHGCGDIFPLGHHRHARLRRGQRADLRGGRDHRLPSHARRALAGQRQGRSCTGTWTPTPSPTRPPGTSSARRSRWGTGGCTPRSAGWPATAGRTRARWSARR